MIRLAVLASVLAAPALAQTLETVPGNASGATLETEPQGVISLQSLVDGEATIDDLTGSGASLGTVTGSGATLETVTEQSEITLENAPPNAATAPGAVLRMADRVDGSLIDLTMENNSTRVAGALTIGLGECRYPIANPASDAFAYVTVTEAEDQLFSGWMIASSPALSAMDHRRYDVWVLRCINVEAAGNDG